MRENKTSFLLFSHFNCCWCWLLVAGAAAFYFYFIFLSIIRCLHCARVYPSLFDPVTVDAIVATATAHNIFFFLPIFVFSVIVARDGVVKDVFALALHNEGVNVACGV